jgi:hypothetical protein
MSRVLKEDIEGRTLNPMGPVRWISPESIAHRVYSKKSDVWMFGALVWGPCTVPPRGAPGRILRDSTKAVHGAEAGNLRFHLQGERGCALASQ